MKKLGIYAALALFVPSVMAEQTVPTSVALAVAEASANINWTMETEVNIDAMTSMKLAQNHQRMSELLDRQLEQKINAQVESALVEVK